MQELGRWMLLAGVVLALVGAVIILLGRAGFRGLPGDIRYESDGVRLYIPIVTCIVLSIVLTAMLWIWRWFQQR